MQTLVVLTTLPDQAAAVQLARKLVEARLAACVNVLASCTSVYRWQGAIEQAQEVPLVIKTTAERYTAMETFVREQHPYELPELIALPVTQGLPAYLDWVGAETRP
ncbi:MAG: divalent-cation tolerance protein CutA [Thiobacillaceae bacterium]|nr:divalent-cation tolerance protein CutA [Thiobacillaceae bacterium]MCX7672686.1 divalent-cation tolerance protein CutA [Thiobacillaceae bacterium]MDW8323705.1 divalent-cation tolerance protein CutA [Burkholderiales bacterium]